MVCSLECSKVTNFKFIKDSLTKNDVPDYNGYCTAEARIDGKPLLPQTKILYQPYIDEPPTDPSTILTAMEDAEQITQAAEQKYTIFTADQQLYAIALNIMTGRNALANEFHSCMRLSDERKWTTSIPFKCICRCQQNAGWEKVPYEYEGT